MTMKKDPPVADLPRFRTRDLNLTAFLSARGCRLLAIDREGGISWFTLEDRDIATLVQDFQSNGDVKVLDFCGRLRQLKSAVHDPAFSIERQR